MQQQQQPRSAQKRRVRRESVETTLGSDRARAGRDHGSDDSGEEGEQGEQQLASTALLDLHCQASPELGAPRDLRE
eukprot:COSAG01_NODE_57176_length_314_cov_0.511628_1_plen_75_part_01